MTNVIRPSRPTRMKASGANASGTALPGIGAPSPGTDTLSPSNRPPPKAIPAFRNALRGTPRNITALASGSGSVIRFLYGQNSRSLCRPLDSCANPLVGTAPADITGHGRIDIGVAWLRIARQQRRCRHDLTGLAIRTERLRGRAK